MATQTIRDRRKLVGLDVILVHRLLKNSVEAPEYVLLSEELYRTGERRLSEHAQEIPHDLEGIGPVLTYVTEIEDVAGPLPPLPEPRWLGRIGRTVDVAGRGMPYMLGPAAPALASPRLSPRGRSRSASASSRLVTSSSPAAAAAG